MPIRVELRGGDARLQQQYLKAVEKKLRDPRNGLIKATNKVAAVFEQNFRRQGGLVGGWADLAEATINNREADGMPAGPILIKYGALKAVVADGFMSAKGPGSWSMRDPYSGHNTRARLSIKGGVATLSAHGWKIANQYGHPNRSGRAVPARPFWFVDRNAMAATKRAFEAWIVKEVVR